MEAVNIIRIRYEVVLRLIESDISENNTSYQFTYPIDFIPTLPSIGESYSDENKTYRILDVRHSIFDNQPKSDICTHHILILAQIEQ